MHYRGISYNETPKSLETSESDVVGHYRGATWKLRQPKQAQRKQSDARLKYRGRRIE